MWLALKLLIVRPQAVLRLGILYPIRLRMVTLFVMIFLAPPFPLNKRRPPDWVVIFL